MFKHAPNEKGMVYSSNGIYPQWKRHYDPNGIKPHNLWSQWK